MAAYRASEDCERADVHGSQASAVLLRLFGASAGKSWSMLERFYLAAEEGKVPIAHGSLGPNAPEDQVTSWCAGHPEPPNDTQKAQLLRCVFGNFWHPVRMAPKEPENIFTAITVLAKEVSNTSTAWLPRSLLTPTVCSIAKAIYEDRKWEDMPILADALEDAGCENQAVLEHLRLKGCPYCHGSGVRREWKPKKYSPHVHVMIPQGSWKEYPCFCKDMPDLKRPPPLHGRSCWVLDLLLEKE